MDNIFSNIDSITPVSNIPSINIYGKDKFALQKPSFTVAIPTYKRVSTLSDAIASALCQKGFDDYNIIVVDNNPERGDETEKFMQRYKDHPKVTYYKNSENVGMAGNWNKCALLSHSDHFILLHDDDIIAPNALYSFRKILSHVNGEWSLIQPQLKKFSDIYDLSFKSFQICRLVKHTVINYFGANCTGAPTVALFNKQYYLKSGGANQVFFPSLDYVLSLSLNRIAPTYSVSVILGGYRVGINESLSKSTMDSYFDMKFRINEQIFSQYRIPNWLGKCFLTKMSFHDYVWVKKYYNMCDYEYDFNNKALYRHDSFYIKIFTLFYYDFLRRIINILNSKVFKIV